MGNVLSRPALIMCGLLCGVMILNIFTLIMPAHWVYAVIACALYGGICLFIMRYAPVGFVLLLWFLFVRFTTMISGIAIESGGFMREILMYGEASGAFVRLLNVYAAGIIVLAVIIESGVRAFPRFSVQIPASWVIPVMVGIGLILAGAGFIGLQYGFPMITGIDRIYYWRLVDNRFLYFFLGNRSILALLLGVIAVIGGRWERIAAFILFITMLVISFLFAEKFTSISILLFTFVTPIFLLNHDALRALPRKVFMLGAVLAVLTMPAVLIVYGVFEDKDAAIDRLQVRATAQAQLWAVADKDQREWLQWDQMRINHNIAAMVSWDAEAISEDPPYLGAKDFMAETMEPARYAHYMERGVTFTMASEAYLLKIFGYMGMMPVYAVILMIYAIYLLYLYYSIQVIDPIRLIFASKLIVWVNFGLNQGYFWQIMGLKTLFLLSVICVYELMIRAYLHNGGKKAAV